MHVGAVPPIHVVSNHVAIDELNLIGRRWDADSKVAAVWQQYDAAEVHEMMDVMHCCWY